jgi:hypothetical protein
VLIVSWRLDSEAVIPRPPSLCLPSGVRLGRDVNGSVAASLFRCLLQEASPLTVANCANVGAKEGGQSLLQCMKVHVSRNFFGAQIASFEQHLPAHDELKVFGEGSTYRAVFIRAPAILSVNSEEVTVLSEYTLSPEERVRSGRESVIVAAESGTMLATAFHPELTEDTRWCDPTNPSPLRCAYFLYSSKLLCSSQACCCGKRLGMPEAGHDASCGKHAALGARRRLFTIPAAVM